MIFVYAFFKFAWSYRLFNYVAILIGAVPPVGDGDRREAEAAAARVARMNVVAGRHFNRGQRAFFFALAYLGWFISAYVFLVSTAACLFVMWRRQLASDALAALGDLEDFGRLGVSFVLPGTDSGSSSGRLSIRRSRHCPLSTYAPARVLGCVMELQPLQPARTASREARGPGRPARRDRPEAAPDGELEVEQHEADHRTGNGQQSQARDHFAAGEPEQNAGELLKHRETLRQASRSRAVRQPRSPEPQLRQPDALRGREQAAPSDRGRLNEPPQRLGSGEGEDDREAEAGRCRKHAVEPQPTGQQDREMDQIEAVRDAPEPRERSGIERAREPGRARHGGDQQRAAGRQDQLVARAEQDQAGGDGQEPRAAREDGRDRRPMQSQRQADREASRLSSPTLPGSVEAAYRERRRHHRPERVEPAAHRGREAPVHCRQNGIIVRGARRA